MEKKKLIIVKGFSVSIADEYGIMVQTFRTQELADEFAKTMAESEEYRSYNKTRK